MNKKEKTSMLFHCCSRHHDPILNKTVRETPTHSLYFVRKQDNLLMTWSKPVFKPSLFILKRGEEVPTIDQFKRSTGRKICEGRMESLKEAVFLGCNILQVQPNELYKYIHNNILKDIEFYIEETLSEFKMTSLIPTVFTVADQRYSLKYISFLIPKKIDPPVSGVYE